MKERLDVGHHDRRLQRRLRESPDFCAEFERQQREIAAIDALINTLDELRTERSLSKAVGSGDRKEGGSAVRERLY